ncbi:MAG: hypothetical protein HRT45_09475 [Bdellovibrionales bacterium]|nr:hypothetical protein [Bdellovibrionales bacterium]
MNLFKTTAKKESRLFKWSAFRIQVSLVFSWLLISTFSFVSHSSFARENPFDGLSHRPGEDCEELGFEIEVRNPEWETVLSPKACPDPGYNLNELVAEEGGRDNIVSGSAEEAR